MEKDSTLAFTGERFVPGARGDIEIEHMHRYIYALDYVAEKTVLDIASGEGYGSALLASRAKLVIGVDIAEDAVAHAQRKYRLPNLRFYQGSCSEIPLDDDAVDLVVSFETIEHHAEHDQMLAEIKRVLRPGGLVLVSSPDKAIYTDKPNYHNPFHVRELYKQEFDSLFRRNFSNVIFLGHKVMFGSGIVPEVNKDSAEFVSADLKAVTSNPGLNEAMYNLVLASDAPLPRAPISFLSVGVETSETFKDLASAVLLEIRRKDEQIARAKSEVNELEANAAQLESRATALEVKAAQLEEEVRRKDEQIARAKSEVNELEANVTRLESRATELRGERAELEKKVSAPEKQISEYVHHLERMKSLLFWKAHELLYSITQIGSRVLERFRAARTKNPTALQEIDISTSEVSNKPETFSKSITAVPTRSFSNPRLMSSAPTPVPIIENPIKAKSDVQLVAFYLPQFHPIPENDRWWGKGFTEWTNVTRAVPQFEGHYQPRLPGELGFYDLRLPEIQQRQLELAELYGVSAFCIYFYWFNGKPLLDKPIENILNSPKLKQQFCLCWANENWSRRWDGLDDEILMKQVYTPEGNIEFIAHISRYLRDPRYLQIDGRPVIGIYRPQLIPSMANAAKRWRQWCRANGIGEIYLFVTHSFGAINPRDYGCDAAVEFPPNVSRPPELTDSYQLLNEKFSGRIFDWSAFVERSRNYSKPDYTLFRTVCPSWDNEARKPGKGHVFVNSSPAGFGEWLQNAILDTKHRIQNTDERLVFVNAWNEWAEGAYLEPDRRFGYAYLEATRVAIARAYARSHKTVFDPASARVAIIIHAFYIDIFREIMELLGEVERHHKVFITTVATHEAEVRSIMDLKSCDYEISVHANQGRDVLPFLTIMKTLDLEAFPFVLKLHTKKSPHRIDGDTWRQQAYSCLARPDQRAWIIKQMCSSPNIGLVGPSDHIVPVTDYLGLNLRAISWIAERLGMKIDFDHDKFIAGTMFCARSEALRPILNIAIGVNDFAPEASQLDGTMAHAIERLFAYSAASAGFKIASVSEGDAEGAVSFGETINHDFAFADRAF